jgi:cation diffusion facilitator CzcD-associated flavoprotein CzcO
MSNYSKAKMRDAVIVGAGVTGIYMLHRLLELGLDATVLDAADGPGGTWYWNRYPGARFDSESYSYGYSFSKEILEEWSWSEHFAGQPETLCYLDFVVEKLGLRDHMQFGCTVKSAYFDDAAACWDITMEDGRRERARYLCMALGILSAATPPRIEGMDDFEGEAFHTYYWPKDREVELAGRRVAVIGTGATGVQVIQTIAPVASELVVFQRRPNWCAPLHNSPIDDETQAKIKGSYDEIFGRMAETHGSFLHNVLPRSYHEASEEERLRVWEENYASPGFGVWLSNFPEVYFDPAVNAVYSEFIAGKIRERVNDPETAELLVPKDHGFGTQRVPLETHYYEAYNRENVKLINATETPIVRITPKGIQTTEQEFEFDLIIYATGFDSFTGSYDRIDIRGVGGQRLSDKWTDGPVTYLGTHVSGFPNMFMLAGPQSASAASNFPPSIEACVGWASKFIEHLESNGITRAEAREEAESLWTSEIKTSYEGTSFAKAKSWFTGYNSNVDGHDRLRHVMFLGGGPAYRAKLAEVAENSYEGFDLA